MVKQNLQMTEITIRPVRHAFRGAEILVGTGADFASGYSVLDCTEAPLPEPAEYIELDSTSRSELHNKETLAPSGWEWQPFRSAINAMPEAAWHKAARGLAYVNWKASTRFCGRCGHQNGDKADELARHCPACGALSFPRISPAVLAAIRRDDKLLLARNSNHKTGIWSILAGFVEPGETLEACVQREVLEEVAIGVNNIRYLGSQPWPFPDQLMVGMTAEWAGGELQPDGVEIAEAGWFGPDDHPPLPMHGSLSRRLIEMTFADIRAGIRH